MEFQYLCSECGLLFEITPDLMLCPECGSLQHEGLPLRGVFEVMLFGKPPENWNIHHIIPVERQYFPEIPVGNTPLWKPERLKMQFGFLELYLKDESGNPTNSLKDRASLMVAAFAKKAGIKDIVVASTGNAASSMAGIGAAAGLNITIFVPETAPEAKLVQALQYGAKVIPVSGNYDLAFDISIEYSKEIGAMSRNTAYNPMTIEGKKTVAIEMVQQLGRAPDHVFVPTGDGVILGGVYKGFEDMKHFGIIDKIPTIHAVQALGSCAICRAVENNDFNIVMPSATIADSIAVDVPRNGYFVLDKLRKHSGKCITVTDIEILDAQKKLSSTAGCFAEPSAAAAFAGFVKVKSSIPTGETVVILITGNGLKDIQSAKTNITMPKRAVKTVQEALDGF